MSLSKGLKGGLLDGSPFVPLQVGAVYVEVIKKCCGWSDTMLDFEFVFDQWYNKCSYNHHLSITVLVTVLYLNRYRHSRVSDCHVITCY